jgi:hypothetical protein
MTWDLRAYERLQPDPFIAWLDAHALLHPGVMWTATQDPVTGMPVYRRGASTGRAWPADKIAGPLVVRPKRRSLGV